MDASDLRDAGPGTAGEHPVAAGGVLVILGASGDLTKRLLMPAVYNLACDGLLPEQFAVVGMARRDLGTDGFRAQQREEIRRFHTRREFDADRWNWLESRLCYTSGEFGDPAAYERLRQAVDAAAAAHGAGGNTLFYLAIAPEFFGTVNRLLDEAGFARRPGLRKIIVEKPFGKDVASAEALNRELLARWREEEIYRIDHYLGKETVQNLLAFRMANGMFAPLWNASHIDHIQISAAETVGVETRGEYYDATGVVRDMIQNHLMQILAYVCMDPPASLDPAAVREEKSRLLAAIRIPSAADVARDCVRGQYGAGRRGDGTPAVAYRAEPRVAPDSDTPTFAAFTLHIDNERWAGMPVISAAARLCGSGAPRSSCSFATIPERTRSRTCWCFTSSRTRGSNCGCGPSGRARASCSSGPGCGSITPRPSRPPGARATKCCSTPPSTATRRCSPGPTSWSGRGGSCSRCSTPGGRFRPPSFPTTRPAPGARWPPMNCSRGMAAAGTSSCLGRCSPAVPCCGMPRRCW